MKIAAAAVVFLAVSSCAPAISWQNANIPKENWAGDQADCRRKANRAIEKELRQDDLMSTGGGYGSSTLSSQLRVFDARKRRQLFLAQCMRERGYVKAKKP